MTTAAGDLTTHAKNATQLDLERVADAISRHKGAGPLHLMTNESAKRQYIAAASAALMVAADVLEDRMLTFPQHGRHTRAEWAVAALRMTAKPHRSEAE